MRILQSSNVDRRVLTGTLAKPRRSVLLTDACRQMVWYAVTRPTSRFVQDYNVLTFNSLTLGYDFDAGMGEESAYRSVACRTCRGMICSVLATVRTERGLDYPYSRSFAASVKGEFLISLKLRRII